MLVAYKKEKWDDSNYEPLDDDTYSDDETYNPIYKDGKIVFKLDKNAKRPSFSSLLPTSLTLTNLN